VRIALLSLAFLTTQAVAMERPRHIKVLFEGTISFKQADTRTELSGKGHAHKWNTLMRTTDIPAKPGTTFGVIFAPKQSFPAIYKTIWHLPPSSASQWPADLASGLYESTLKCDTTPCGTGYTLHDPWELVPGPWVLELWQQDRFIYTQTFQVRTE
jgi:hypothetical protein